MFLSLRDLRFARGRFALIGSVVAMITLLVVMLTGLTDGLGRQSTSALEALEAPRIVLAAGRDGKDPSYSDSRIDAQQAGSWARAEGVEAAERFDVGRAQLEHDGASASAAVLALQPGTELAPDLEILEGRARPGAGQTVLSQDTAQSLGVGVGDELDAGALKLTVIGIAADEWYSHSPVLWTSTEDSAQLLRMGDGQSSALAVFPADGLTGGELEDRMVEQDEAAGTWSAGTRDSFAALPAYSSERGSLLMMQAFLYGIGALVVIAFLTVWSIQRTREVAILRALGAASRGWVLRDALAQSAAVLLGGTALGLVLGGLGGALVTGAVPFSLTPATTLVPALGILLLGLAAALLAVRRVARVDPQIALSAA
ncbi:ABC transporter permease [Kocuria palustris]|uniref:ABC transporter permease n=1 Tax=Kocuria palustris TaxID=71999 RepID=UPI00344DF5F7